MTLLKKSHDINMWTGIIYPGVGNSGKFLRQRQRNVGLNMKQNDIPRPIKQLLKSKKGKAIPVNRQWRPIGL
jgi:hypothetical protein